MSLPDSLLDDEGDVCEVCGAYMSTSRYILCMKCRIEEDGERADEKISEGRY